MLRTETVTKECMALLKILMADPLFNEFRLVGGTALALYYGHRKSVDIDLFTDTAQDFNDMGYKLVTSFGNHLQDARVSPMGIFATIMNIKTDLINWGHTFRFNYLQEEKIRLATPLEISAMKLEAINNRSTKKDFIDLAVLLEHFSVTEIIENYKLTFPYYDYYQALKALSYFEPAENNAMPEMLIPLTWDQAKEKISISLKKYWESSL